MAGVDASFDQAGFESGIRFAMRMGLHPDESEWPKFHFRAVKTWPEGTKLSQDGRPLDPSIRPTTVQPDPVHVLCAYEFTKAEQNELPVGGYRPTKLTLTLLEAEFQQIKEATEVEVGGDRYKIGYEIPPRGLFQSGVRQLACFARDES